MKENGEELTVSCVKMAMTKGLHLCSLVIVVNSCLCIDKTVCVIVACQVGHCMVKRIRSLELISETVIKSLHGY